MGLEGDEHQACSSVTQGPAALHSVACSADAALFNAAQATAMTLPQEEEAAVPTLSYSPARHGVREAAID